MKRIKYIDKLSRGRISRREMLAGAAAFGVGVTVLPRFPRAAETLTVMEWASYETPDHYQSYMAKYGQEPSFSLFSTEEEALAKVRAGYSADVMHPCNYSVDMFVDAGLAVPIDTARLSNWKDVFPALQTAEGTMRGGHVVMAPADWGNSSIAYRPDLVGDDFKKNESWSIFFDDKYAGRVSMADLDLTFTIAAMVNGKTYEESYNMRGEQLAAMKAMAEKAVKTSRFLWSDATTLNQALASGEIVAGYAWNDTIKFLSGEGVDIAYAKPKEGYFTWFCGLTLLSTGKADLNMAYDFIDAWLSPETGKLMIEDSGYGHANMKSFEVADQAMVKAMGITDPVEHMKSAILFKPVSTDSLAEQAQAWAEVKALKQ